MLLNDAALALVASAYPCSSV